MARPIQDVTEAELAVLQVLWDRDPATILIDVYLLYLFFGARRAVTKPSQAIDRSQTLGVR